MVTQNQQHAGETVQDKVESTWQASFDGDKLWGCSSSALLRTIYSDCAVLQGKEPG